jgi:UDP-N-acetylglucosamine 2-epimerase (non-hydrolysing)
MRIGLIVGTRPEIIKTWSVIEEIKSRKDIDLVLIHTGQHYDYEMSKVFFEDLSIRQPDYYLEVGSHPPPVLQTTRIMQEVSKVLSKEPMDILLVQGDTNSCMGAALAAVQMKVPIGHIEAGCRSFDRTMPEEINRTVIDSIANLLFAPSETAYHNLMMEGHDDSRAFLTGNTALDALEEGLRLTESRDIPAATPYAVATIHRAANTDDRGRLSQILEALSKLPMKCIFPIHPRTEKMIETFNLIDIVHGSLETTKPIGYISFINLLKHSSLVITDSGGVQEEAVLLGKPTVTIRKNTEWPETVWIGLNELTKATAADIVSSSELVMKRTETKQDNLYLGNAGHRIVDVIVNAHNKSELVYEEVSLIDRGYPELQIKESREGHLIAFDERGYPVRENGKRFLVKGYRPLKFEQDGEG